MSLYDSIDDLTSHVVYGLSHGSYSDYTVAAICKTKREAEWYKTYLCASAATKGNHSLPDYLKKEAVEFSQKRDVPGLMGIIAQSIEAREKFSQYTSDMFIEVFPFFKPELDTKNPG